MRPYFPVVVIENETMDAIERVHPNGPRGVPRCISPDRRVWPRRPDDNQKVQTYALSYSPKTTVKSPLLQFDNDGRDGAASTLPTPASRPRDCPRNLVPTLEVSAFGLPRHI